MPHRQCRYVCLCCQKYWEACNKGYVAVTTIIDTSITLQAVLVLFFRVVSCFEFGAFHLQVKVMAPAHSEPAAVAGASTSTAPPKQLSKLMSGPQRTPMVAAPMSEQVSTILKCCIKGSCGLTAAKASMQHLC